LPINIRGPADFDVIDTVYNSSEFSNIYLHESRYLILVLVALSTSLGAVPSTTLSAEQEAEREEEGEEAGEGALKMLRHVLYPPPFVCTAALFNAGRCAQ
jgi:hypothetical protein